MSSEIYQKTLIFDIAQNYVKELFDNSLLYRTLKYNVLPLVKILFYSMKKDYFSFGKSDIFAEKTYLHYSKFMFDIQKLNIDCNKIYFIVGRIIIQILHEIENIYPYPKNMNIDRYFLIVNFLNDQINLYDK